MHRMATDYENRKDYLFNEFVQTNVDVGRKAPEKKNVRVHFNSTGGS